MVRIYLTMIWIILFNYFIKCKTREIEKLLTKVESVIPSYDLTTQSALASNKDIIYQQTKNGYIGESFNFNKKTVIGNEIKGNISVAIVDKKLVGSCKPSEMKMQKNVQNTEDNLNSSNGGFYECENGMETQCPKSFAKSYFGDVFTQKTMCRRYSNVTTVICLRNFISKCSTFFYTNIDIAKLYPTESFPKFQQFTHTVVIEFQEIKSRPVIFLTSPKLYRTSSQCQLLFDVIGLFHYEIQIIHNNLTTVIDKGYDKRSTEIRQTIGYMDEYFRIKIIIKPSTHNRMNSNNIQVTEVKLTNCTNTKEIAKAERENSVQRCTFEHGLCSWISPTNYTACQFDVVSGLDVAKTRRKAFHDYTNNSFVGHFLYMHARTKCYRRSTSLRTVLYQYNRISGNSTCKVSFAIIGTLMLHLWMIIPTSDNNISLWNQSYVYDNWTVKELVIPAIDDTLSFYLLFETATSTDIYRDYIAIDDISFSDGCSFQEFNNHVQKMTKDNEDSLEVIIPVLASATFLTVILGIIAVISKWYGRQSIMRKGDNLHKRPVKWTCLKPSDSMLPSIANLCNIEDFLTKKNPNYEWYSGRILNNKLTDIPRDKLKISNKIGNGAFGEVYSGIIIQDYPVKKCRHVAVKTVLQGSSEKARVDFFLEALTLSKFSHPNIVEFLGVSVDKTSILLVLEYMPGGDLKDYLRKLRSGDSEDIEISSSKMIDMCVDVAKACKYLEEIKFVHRDIAARNCLLTSRRKDTIVKIADFGLARDILSSDYYRKTGSAMLPVRWMSPESFSEGMFSNKSDVWSFGVLMWEIYTYAQIPYDGYSNTSVITLIITGRRLEKPLLCNQKLYDIMSMCWRTDPRDRPTFTEILSHLEAIKQLQNNEVHRTPKKYVRQKKYNTYTSDEFESSPLASTSRT